MKSRFIFWFLWYGGLFAAAQGTLNFANGAAGVNAPVVLADSGQLVAGSSWKAELLLQQPDGSLKQVGAPVAFQDQAMAGYFFGGLIEVPGVGIGEAASFRIRAFHINGAIEGLSKPVRVKLGGEKYLPANLAGLERWTVKMVRPILTAALENNEVVLSWSQDFSTFVLQSTVTLNPSQWSPVEVPSNIQGTLVLVRVPAVLSARYFRLRSN